MKTLIILVTLLLSSPLYADDPNSTGAYYDPDFDGRGAFVFQRDAKHFLGFFTHVRKCRHRDQWESIAALDGDLVLEEDYDRCRYHGCDLVLEEDYDRCRYHGWKRIQQWFITELCPMNSGQMICPIYMTVPHDDVPLGAPLAEVIDIGTAFINDTQCGFSMLIQHVPNPVLEPDAEVYHEQFDFRSYIFGI
jgi:hypothetical protein